MPWQKQPIAAPVSDAIVGVVDGVATVLSVVQPILTIAETALDVAKVFLHGVTDPAAALFDALVGELENLINDFFGTGAYFLEVNPFNIQASGLIGSVVPGFTPSTAPKIITHYDDFGIPLMTPSECINNMVLSFEDTGDVNRPQFSNEAEVVSVGFMLTAPSVEGFLTLIDQFLAVFHWPGFDLMKVKLNNAKNIAPKSTYPDWISYRLNSIQQMKEVQQALLGLLNTLKGYRSLLNNVFDLIDMLEKKVKTLQDIVKKFKTLLDNLKNAIKATGIYVFDFPAQVGGNKAVQTALRDPYLESICTINNGYTAGLLLLGGGPSIKPIQTIKDLIL